jgi:hypothetical protein
MFRNGAEVAWMIKRLGMGFAAGGCGRIWLSV